MESVGGMQKASGYELLRRITEEFSLQSRNEALLSEPALVVSGPRDQLAGDCVVG